MTDQKYCFLNQKKKKLQIFFGNFFNMIEILKKAHLKKNYSFESNFISLRTLNCYLKAAKSQKLTKINNVP